jgi:Holliday junction DNA helicase RuvB
MEDRTLPITIGQGAGAKVVTLDLPPFTLIGATTRAGLLTTPLRDRFGIQHRLEAYDAEDLARIVRRSAGILASTSTTGGAWRSPAQPRHAARRETGS